MSNGAASGDAGEAILEFDGLISTRDAVSDDEVLQEAD